MKKFWEYWAEVQSGSVWKNLLNNQHGSWQTPEIMEYATVFAFTSVFGNSFVGEFTVKVNNYALVIRQPSVVKLISMCQLYLLLPGTMLNRKNGNIDILFNFVKSLSFSHEFLLSHKMPWTFKTLYTRFFQYINFLCVKDGLTHALWKYANCDFLTERTLYKLYRSLYIM